MCRRFRSRDRPPEAARQFRQLPGRSSSAGNFSGKATTSEAQDPRQHLPVARGGQYRKPHPCGHLGHPRLPCRCTEVARERYKSRLSGPLLDRIDIHVNVPPVEVAALIRKGGGESSAAVRARVLRARARQQTRAKALGLASYLNATLPASALEKVAPLDDESKKLIEGAVTRLGLSARAFNKVLRVARTLADLEGEESVRASHVGEAIQGRILDRTERR
ncbi:MAG TPA: ATP-binding protein [Polyangiaceae bacterium]|nr:ATP-binding protein [Polyangiaceae bacterium]